MIKISTNFENFKNALKQILGATANNKNIPIGNVLFKIFNDKIELVATDGNRIRLKRLMLDEVINLDKPVKVLINADTLYNQIKNFKVTDKTFKDVISAFFELDVDEKSFIFACPHIGLQKIDITMLDYNYPNYEQLIIGYNNVDDDFMALMRNNTDTLKVSFTTKYLLDYLKNLDKDAIITFEIAHNLGMINLYNSSDTALFEGIMPVKVKDVTTSQKWGQ